MKRNYLLLIAILAINYSFAQVFINEIHYDNSGADVDEGVEIAGEVGIDLSCYSIVLYNGSNNTQYDSIALTGILPDDGCGTGAIWTPIPGLQNGAPDGIGLYNHCTSTSIQFLSYEGTMTAVDGAFIGQLSEDIGVSEINATTPIGASLFLIGTGTQYSDFTWTDSTVNSYNSINDGQIFCISQLPAVSFKTDSFTFNEGDGAIFLDSLLINPAIASPVTEQFEIHLSANSTADQTDFSISAGIPITLPYTHILSLPMANFTALPINATIIDDALIEGDEIIEVVLRNAQNGIKIGNDSILYVTIIENDFPADTFVELSSMSITQAEDDGSFNINMDYLQTAANSNHTVDLALISGDMADIDNYMTQTVSFSSLSESVTITITDDALVENTDTFVFALQNATNGLVIGSDSIFTLILEDNDVALSTIGSINGQTPMGPDSAGVEVKIKGIVNSMDRGFLSLEFSIQDPTGAITVFTNTSPFSGNDPQVGDELEIIGIVSNSFGVVTLQNLSSYDSLSTGNPVMPMVTTAPDDMNESSLIRINELTLIDPAQWIAAGGAGFDVFATDPAGDTVKIRIDRDYVDLYNSTAPNSALIDVIGVAGQFDLVTPFDEGYQIIPRDLNDIILYPTISVSSQGSTEDEDAGSTIIDFVVANDIGNNYTIDLELTGGNGTADDIDNFATMTGIAINGGIGSATVTITDDSDLEANETFEFTISNPSAGLLIGNENKYELIIEDNDASGIEEINVNALSIFPNPTSREVVMDMISNETQLANISVLNAIGKEIVSQSYILDFGKNKISMDLSSLAKGTYSITISTEKGSHSKNLMVK